MTEEKLICPSCHHGFSTEQMMKYKEEEGEKVEFEKECAVNLANTRRISLSVKIGGMPTLFVIFLFLLSLQVKISDPRFSYVILGGFVLSCIFLGLVNYWVDRIKKRLFQEWKETKIFPVTE